MQELRGLAQPQKHFISIDKQLAKRSNQQQRSQSDRRAIAKDAEQVMQTVTSLNNITNCSCHLRSAIVDGVGD